MVTLIISVQDNKEGILINVKDSVDDNSTLYECIIAQSLVESINWALPEIKKRSIHLLQNIEISVGLAKVIPQIIQDNRKRKPK